MFTLTQIGAAVSELESLTGTDAASRTTNLRHLTQRLPIVARGRQWRAGTYDAGTVAALRVVQVANDLGINRAALVALIDFFRGPIGEPPMIENRPGEFHPGDTGDALAVAALAGETFSVFLHFTRDGGVVPALGPLRGEQPAGGGHTVKYLSGDVIATVEIKASGLIRDLLRKLGA